MSAEYVTDKQVLLEIRRLVKQQLAESDNTDEFCALLYLAKQVEEATGFNLRKD